MPGPTRRGNPPRPRTPAPDPDPAAPAPYRHGVGGATLHLRRGGCVTLYRHGPDVTLTVAGLTAAVGTVVLDAAEAAALAREMRRG